MNVILAGSLAGLLHVVSGPDHLVAVAPLAMKRPAVGLRIGLTWGVGHAAGVILVGMLGVLLRSFVDITILSRWAEFIVGFVLIGVGLWAISQMRKVVLHRHPHHHAIDSLPPPAHAEHATDAPLPQGGKPAHQGHDGIEPGAPGAAHRHPHPHAAESLSPPKNAEHAHIHVHAQGQTHDERAHHRHHTRGSFLVGLVHGAAGTGHLLGVIPSLALPPVLGATYLGCYGVAAVVAMGGFGLVMGIIGNRLQPKVLRGVMLGCGILAIGLGVFWLGSAW